MDRMWAPWRQAYIRRHKKRKKKSCLFCSLIRQNQDKRNHILKRTRHSFALLNLYPYNNGHVMILPRRHVDSTVRLTDEQKLDLLGLYEEVLSGLKKVMRPHGFNAGINLGQAGGAGIPRHLHLHLVPRWRGDANFMPVVAQTKIISQSLNSVYQSLAKVLHRRNRTLKRKRKKT